MPLPLPLPLPLPSPLRSQALLAAVIIGSIAARYGAHWPTCLCTAPVVIAITRKLYANAAVVLPDVSRHR
jgi:hypothetical protein